MEIFEIILFMLSAVFISNVLSKFIPNIAFPLIQIVLGICLTLPFASHSLELSPELFLLLFMAPLLFNDAARVDKGAIWGLRKPILLMSLGLVFMTVLLLGLFIHWLLPGLPYAAAFALAAALGPTDAVAVGALAKKVKVPHSIMHTLEGESLINDASGLVSFQFAVAALLTGTFSIVDAGTSFIFQSVGGVLVGSVLSLLKIVLMRWLRNFGVENEVSYVLMEILLPFLIFMAAEELGVNGILAVVFGGIVHSLSYKKLNAEVAQLKLLSRSTWAIISYSLNGLVFVLLGMQLPKILVTIWKNEFVNNGMLILYIVSITAVLLGLRLIWVRLFNNFGTERISHGGKEWKTTFLYTIAGVRGTITLVSALSLPFVLSDGTLFAERDLLLSIAAGVILLTLLLANFTLPLFAPKAVSGKERPAVAEEIAILRRVTKKLREKRTEDNQEAVGRVIRTYNDRIMSLTRSGEMRQDEKKLRRMILDWQLADTLNLVKQGKVKLRIAYPALWRLNRKLFIMSREKRYRRNLLYIRLLKKRFHAEHFHLLTAAERREQHKKLFRSNRAFILERLKDMDESTFPRELVEMFIMLYQRKEGRRKAKKDTAREERNLLYFAIQTERDYIQQFFEKGKISRNDMKRFRENLLAIENSLSLND
ncbi:cation:proton antiporter [Aciduricibacillus chroicocephali]|uniref:Cation:proton antiporter n=1 Tax=Aciduricibacillus chroicocephali TaxID=3054939 RepID=A0ABY9KX26_9BACI|nr:cation:proton antiporter [Bacillaceae bacterium 44XB]